VFVRGLGERYSSTTLNGSSIPTTEPEKRVVPLDLFPAKLLENINVIKTYTPDKSGEFGGGSVELVTLDFPTAASLKVTLGAATDPVVTGEGFGRYAGGLSWFGSGGQAMPSAVPMQRLEKASIVNPSGFSPQELEAIGDSFQPTWLADAPTSAPYNGNFSVAYGNTFGRLGVVLSATSTHGYDLTDEVQKYYGLDAGDTLVIRNDYEMTTDAESARSGLVGNFSLNLGEGQRVTLNSLYTRDSLGETRQFDGYNSNAGQIFRDYRLRYQQEEVASTRLAGEHSIPGIGLTSLLEWSGTYSTASNHSDLRESLYYERDPGVYALQGSSESGKMEYFDLEDEVVAGAASWATFFSMSASTYGSVKGGLAYSDRTRDFGARRFRFVTDNPNQFDLTLPPDQLFTQENIRPDGFEILEQTSVNDAYDAAHTIGAVFLMGDATVGKWRFIAGARYEDSEQTVDTYDPFAPGSPTSSVNEDADILPALNIVYQLSPRSNLRFGASRTLNRPEFRELTPFQFTEVTGGRSIAGNPDLTRAVIDSVDLRWETFPEAGEVIAVSAFYKLLTDPIERIIQPTTELRTSYTNAEEATLWGGELELRRSLALLSPALRYWSANLNYTYTSSDVTIGDVDLSVITNTQRPLEGQAAHTGNAALQFHHPVWGTMVRALYNYSGERITDVGAYGLPDIYEQSFGSLDLMVSQQLRFLKGLEVKLGAGNLLDESRLYTQAGLVQREYSPGRTFSLSFGYTIF
jgi:TonB-dependent receptor